MVDHKSWLGEAYLQNCSAQGDMVTLGPGSISSKRRDTVPAQWPHAEWTPPKNSYLTGWQAWDLHLKLVAAAKHCCFL
jgi:hypothetical protein